jgi:hypothetical protein
MLGTQTTATATTVGPEDQGQAHRAHDQDRPAEAVQLDRGMVFVAPTTTAVANLLSFHSATIPP